MWTDPAALAPQQIDLPESTKKKQKQNKLQVELKLHGKQYPNMKK